VPFEGSKDGTCHSENRFDDSAGHFAVLYASSTRLGCFVETLARFRQAPLGIVRELHEIEYADTDQPTLGVVPASWLSKRRMGYARFAKKQCADIYSAEWLSYLRRTLEVRPSGVIADKEFDLSDLMSRNRRVSQRASTLVHGLGDLGGIYYLSRHGKDLHNWALFEPVDFVKHDSSEFDADDLDFRNALKLLDLELVS
jgi:hypothetical protein